MTRRETRQVVARASDVKPGSATVVSVKGRDIGIFYLVGEFFALANRCPHAGGPLCQGRIVALVQSDGPGHYRLARQQEFLRCPGHGWEFDIRTGQSWCDPNSTRARQFAHRPNTVRCPTSVSKPCCWSSAVTSELTAAGSTWVTCSHSRHTRWTCWASAARW